MEQPRRKQSLISSFFGSKTQDKPVRKPLSSTTPEKVKRSDSVLSKATNSNDGFEEVGSSDISFGSPEVNNFKNPLLLQSFQRKSMEVNQSILGEDNNDDDDIVVVSQSSGASKKSFNQGFREESKDRNRKRGQDFLMNHLNGVPKKIAKPNNNGRDGNYGLKLFDTSLKLSEQQISVLKLAVEDGKNIFYTGSAGTGKSVVLRELVKHLRRKHGSSNVGVTASTGLAACNIGGQTLHRLLAIGLGTGSPTEMMMKIKKNPSLVKKWKTLKVLIIDEISMIDGVLFTKLNELAKLVRQSNRPFGGIQIICTGDFFQLPPVAKGGTTCQFCFESPCWNKVIDKTILLSQVFRQKNDNELIDMLNAIRYGTMTPDIISKFKLLERERQYDDGIEPTELYPTREEVKQANQKRLSSLSSSSRRFIGHDSTTLDYHIKMLDNLMCEKELILKPGAQVMYLKNYDENVVNGSIGKVLFFSTENLYLRIKEYYGESYLDNASLLQEIMLLTSRVGVTSDWSDPERLAFEQIPKDRQTTFAKLCHLASNEKESDLFPLVQFQVPHSDSVILLIKPEPFSVNIGKSNSPEDVITREQLPLLLSWAMSIHKSQGQTIKRLRIDLRKVFEKGQVYVALSRTTDKNNLEIRNFDPKKITVSEKVKQFYRSMEDQD